MPPKEYDVIAMGTGSAMNIVDGLLRQDEELKVAVIDKDEPGGICLTRGCIPSKLLLYPAEVVRTVQRAGKFGLDVELKGRDFKRVMDRMRSLIGEDIESIRRGLSQADRIDYYHAAARFVEPYTLEVDGERIRADTILLCTGSKIVVPPVDGLEEAGYLTSDTILELEALPPSVAVVGGGYIAAEYGHFLAAMGAEVTIVGRNPQFLPEEEPEVAALARRKLEVHMTIISGHEVRRVEVRDGEKVLTAVETETGEERTVAAAEILVATGRGPTHDLLQPEKGGIETDEDGWIKVNERLETSQPGVYAMGDAVGVHPFKHVANHESLVVYRNLMGHEATVDYHAVPHAVFTYPEVAAVGMKEAEAVAEYGEENVAIGFQRYEDTAKGEAMGVHDYFVKVIVKREDYTILGCHIVGPYASILIHEVINLMYTPSRSALPMFNGMHIHPALSEVVDRAFGGFMSPDQYRHVLEENGLAPA